MDYQFCIGTKSDKKGIAEIITETFFKEFEPYVSSKNIIVSLMTPFIHEERFYIAKDSKTKEIVAALGISDEKGYSIDVPRKGILKEFGYLKGLFFNALISSEFYRPKNFQEKQGHIAYVSVRENLRGHGIGKNLLEGAIQNFDYHTFTLDVMEGNEIVLPLFERAGFQFVEKQKEFLSPFRNFSFRYFMEKKIEG